MALMLLMPLILFIYPSVAQAEMDVVVSRPTDWVIESADSAGEGKLPKILFKAPGDRDAGLYVIQLGTKDDQLKDSESFRDFHIRVFKHFHREPPNAEEIESFSSEHGEFLLSTHEDPKLKGKPIVRGDYKFSTQITCLIDNRYIVVCNIFSQSKEGLDVEEAKAAIKKIKAK